MNRNMSFLFVLLVGVATAQQKSEINTQVPPEVQKIIDDEFNGRGPFLAPNGIKNVQPGTPFLRYWLFEDSIKKYNENTPISKLVVPYNHHFLGEWDVPVLANGKIRGFLGITKLDSILDDPNAPSRKRHKNEQWHAGSFSGLHGIVHAWEKVMQKWPESKGYHPIFVETASLTHRFFYVPEKGDSNLTYINISQVSDSLSTATDSTFSVLSDSKFMLKFLRDHLLKVSSFRSKP